MKLILKRIGLVFGGLIGIVLLAFLFTSGKVSKVQLSKTIYIEVPKEELWKITALDFGGNSKWDAGVNVSEGRGNGLNGSVVGERACYVAVAGIDKIVEQFVEYDADNYRFKYTGTEGMPDMLKSGTNEWIHKTKGNGTQMTMVVNMELQGLMGIIMKETMEEAVSTRLGEALEELKVFAETGKPHPRKIAANKKYKAEQAKK
ncbi:SRPBCC family protein [Aquimarina sp. 2304DJ70-9]|uniref:SRPBCC family protein n=1 Tax=Aquimarina penaris TaxID=3231044 RepID=UPI003461C3A1